MPRVNKPRPRLRYQAVAEHASGDKRFKILEAHMKKHQFMHDALIEVLHKAQELFGFLEDDLLIFIAHKLKLPASRVYGVATFYHFFRLTPRGKYVISVCMGTACYVKGADKVLEKIREELGIDFGETTRDGLFSLEEARCLGTCGLAPVLMINDEVHAKVSPDKVPALLERYAAQP